MNVYKTSQYIAILVLTFFLHIGFAQAQSDPETTTSYEDQVALLENTKKTN